MAFIDSSRLRRNAAIAVKGAAQSAAPAAVAAMAAVLLCEDAARGRSVAIGVVAAWLASTLSATALIMALAVSVRAFWWTFGGGIAVRLLVLAGLMGYGLCHPQLSQPALLLAYALGVLGFLLIEYRFLRPV